jgi:hypothetical protein
MFQIRALLPWTLPIVAATVAGLSSASAETMSFYMKNQTTRSVVVELYAQDRQHVWPGDDQVYYLETGEKKSVPIECTPGERICWGAWRYGNDRWTWGTGPDNGRTCDDCCSLCVPSGTETIDLSE